jgi:hypothetical protein
MSAPSRARTPLVRTVAACLLALLAGCGASTLGAPPTLPLDSATPTTAETTAALMQPPPYDRDRFGSGWIDADGDGCDTRDEVLSRDALGATVGADGCVDHVVIIDPYTGQRVDGRAEIDIDHVVALGDAWRSGAYAWTDDAREAFANDEVNLLATSDDVNRAKSDRGPDRWRPPDRGGWCNYAHLYGEVKRTYQLAVTGAQTAALAELSTGCGR